MMWSTVSAISRAPFGRNGGCIIDDLPGVLPGDTKLAGKERYGDPPPFHIVPDPGHCPVNVGSVS